MNIANSDFDLLLPLFSTKKNNSLFQFYTIGVSTNRDEWVFDLSPNELTRKMGFFIKDYNQQVATVLGLTKDNIDQKIKYTIKWSDKLKSFFLKKDELEFNKNNLRQFDYRPFYRLNYYSDKKLSDRLTSNHNELLGLDLVQKNLIIAISGNSSSRPFQALGIDKLFGVDFLEKTQSLPLYRYDSKGNRHDNITDWGLEQFQMHYKNKKVNKEDIFYYTYAVLHNPAYRTKYELNLKREFPRLPYYENFKQWKEWGKELMDLHINYDAVKPFALKEITSATKAEHKKTKELFAKAEEPDALYGRKEKIKAKLKADKEKGIIEIDELTTLIDVPAEAWEYKLGNRSALEWVLDQYKEKKPSDPTILEKFNTYRFADYKEHVIDLLKKVCTVSVETMKVIDKMT